MDNLWALAGLPTAADLGPSERHAGIQAVIPSLSQTLLAARVLLCLRWFFRQEFWKSLKSVKSSLFIQFSLERVTLSGRCGLTRSDGRRWETNYKDSETQSASFAAT